MQSMVVGWVASQKVCRCAANYATAWFVCPASAELSKGLTMGIQPIITMSRFAGLVDMMKVQGLLLYRCAMRRIINAFEGRTDVG